MPGRLEQTHLMLKTLYMFGYPKENIQFEFMEGFNIPWAPVLGNHETESRMGVDWQCAQLENAKNCLFKQRTLTGNGNYTVGVKQDGKLIRVFYMVDSNSGSPSEKSIANGHSQHKIGFGADQIEWFTGDIKSIRNKNPYVNISFMFHIPIHAFELSLEKYGYSRQIKVRLPSCN